MTIREGSKLFLATAGGLGYVPLVPGSAAAIVAVVIFFLTAAVIPTSTSAIMASVWLAASQLGVIFGSVVLHYKLYDFSVRTWKSPDASEFVQDEVFGQAVTLFFLAWATEPVWVLAVYGFLSFRLFDIIKLPGAREIDRHMHDAHGALLDDLVSALYAASTFLIVHRILDVLS